MWKSTSSETKVEPVCPAPQGFLALNSCFTMSGTLLSFDSCDSRLPEKWVQNTDPGLLAKSRQTENISCQMHEKWLKLHLLPETRLQRFPVNLEVFKEDLEVNMEVFKEEACWKSQQLRDPIWKECSRKGKSSSFLSSWLTGSLSNLESSLFDI